MLGVAVPIIKASTRRQRQEGPCGSRTAGLAQFVSSRSMRDPVSKEVSGEVQLRSLHAYVRVHQHQRTLVLQKIIKGNTREQDLVHSLFWYWE